MGNLVFESGRQLLILFRFNTYLSWGKSSNFSVPEFVLCGMVLTVILYSGDFVRVSTCLAQCLAQKCSKLEGVAVIIACVIDDAVLQQRSKPSCV